MNTDQNLAISIHNASLLGRDTVRDGDLLRLLDLWPDLRTVFEEVQFLRDDNSRLEDNVAALEDERDDLIRALEDYEE